MLALDLGVFHRKRREITIKNALVWTFIWVLMAVAFAGVIFLWQGKQESAEFLTGYIIEKALSLDNIFVIALIFTHFQTPPENQHKILFWGIVGALIMRALFILGGVALLEKFHWTIYVFGAILIYTGVRILFKKHEDIKPEDTWFVRFCRRHLRFTDRIEKGRFFVLENGKRYATPLLLALIVVEATDLMFAVDSIPAILAITKDSFIVYTSNVFAILGLRSLYFALAGIIEKFTYLQPALAIILIFVGAKMALEEVIDIPIYVTLPAVLLILGGAILLSLIKKKPKPSVDLPND